MSSIISSQLKKQMPEVNNQSGCKSGYATKLLKTICSTGHMLTLHPLLCLACYQCIINELRHALGHGCSDLLVHPS